MIVSQTPYRVSLGGGGIARSVRLGTRSSGTTTCARGTPPRFRASRSWRPRAGMKSLLRDFDAIATGWRWHPGQPEGYAS